MNEDINNLLLSKGESGWCISDQEGMNRLPPRRWYTSSLEEALMVMENILTKNLPNDDQ